MSKRVLPLTGTLGVGKTTVLIKAVETLKAVCRQKILSRKRFDYFQL